MKKRLLGKNGHWLSAGICIPLLICMFLTPLWGETTDKKNSPDSSLPGIQREVVIQKKTPDSILAGDHRFLVAAGEIVMIGGDALTLGKLPVPCKAKIYYVPDNTMDPTILRIDVISFGAGATTTWTPSAPE